MKKSTIKNENIILEQRYLKQKYIIVEEVDTPNNDTEYINLIKDNGFTLKPYTTNMVWKYENDKTKVYTYKLKSGDIYLGQTQFLSSTNPTWNGSAPYVSEVALYNDEKELMVVSKIQSPEKRQGIQQYPVKLDF